MVVLVKTEAGNCAKTGIASIDYLTGCLPEGIAVEIYGDFELLYPASYTAAATLHCRGGAVLGIVQEGPLNYDLFAVRSLLRNMGCSEESFLISRAFRLEDAAEMLRDAADLPHKSVIVFDPYAHSPSSPKEYAKLTPLTAAIRKASSRGKRVLLLNRVTKFGRFLPEGGKMHHHSVAVIVRIEKSGRRSYRAILVKHPTRPQISISGPLRELYGASASWEEQPLLLEWL